MYVSEDLLRDLAVGLRYQGGPSQMHNVELSIRNHPGHSRCLNNAKVPPKRLHGPAGLRNGEHCILSSLIRCCETKNLFPAPFMVSPLADVDSSREEYVNVRGIVHLSIHKQC